MQFELTRLTNALTSFVKESSERSVRLETNQENLNESVTEMGKQASKAICINIRLEEKLTALEDKALDRLSLIEDSVNENSAYMATLDKRIQILELINANTQGRKETIDKLKKTLADNWFKVVLLIALLLPLASYLYKEVYIMEHPSKTLIQQKDKTS